MQHLAGVGFHVARAEPRAVVLVLHHSLHAWRLQ
jgi:hypothetical protein